MKKERSQPIPRNTNDFKNVLWAAICQQIRQSKRNGCTSGKPQITKTGEISNTKANLAPKGAGEKTANRSYTQQKKRINKRFEQNSTISRPEELWNRSTEPGVGSLKELTR